MFDMLKIKEDEEHGGLRSARRTLELANEGIDLDRQL
jgi:hypothetical protein